jgi:hypothetical protein
MSDPSVARADLPVGYGLPVDSVQLSWTDVNERLRTAVHYWICIVGVDDVPIVRPIDGIWLEHSLYFGGDPGSRWWRNLRAGSCVGPLRRC